MQKRSIRTHAVEHSNYYAGAAVLSKADSKRFRSIFRQWKSGTAPRVTPSWRALFRWLRVKPPTPDSSTAGRRCRWQPIADTGQPKPTVAQLRDGLDGIRMIKQICMHARSQFRAWQSQCRARQTNGACKETERTERYRFVSITSIRVQKIIRSVSEAWGSPVLRAQRAVFSEALPRQGSRARKLGI